MKKKKIIFVFSDTAGGHRSAAEAVISSMKKYHDHSISCEMVDFLKDYAPFPFHKLPWLYPRMTKLPTVWKLGYKITDSPRRTKIIESASWRYSREAMNRLISDHPADLIVSLHPGSNGPLLNSLDYLKNSTPFVTVVTDLVATHNFWYDDRANLIIVATEQAKDLAHEAGISTSKLKVIGLPTEETFTPASHSEKAKLRAKHGFNSKKPLVLILGGGEGMGNIGRISKYISAHNDIELVIICGRNKVLADKLSAQKWASPTHVLGFTRQMSELMRAADIIITKAGPGTITEAINTNLPIILYDFLPGQEEDNVTYVLENKAGLWAPTPYLVSDAINKLITDSQTYNSFVQAASRLSHPTAAKDIADTLANLLKL